MSKKKILSTEGKQCIDALHEILPVSVIYAEQDDTKYKLIDCFPAGLATKINETNDEGYRTKEGQLLLLECADALCEYYEDNDVDSLQEALESLLLQSGGKQQSYRIAEQLWYVYKEAEYDDELGDFTLNEGDAYDISEVRAIKQLLTPEIRGKLVERNAENNDYSAEAAAFFEHCGEILKQELEGEEKINIYVGNRLQEEFKRALQQKDAYRYEKKGLAHIQDPLEANLDGQQELIDAFYSEMDELLGTGENIDEQQAKKVIASALTEEVLERLYEESEEGQGYTEEATRFYNECLDALCEYYEVGSSAQQLTLRDRFEALCEDAAGLHASDAPIATQKYRIAEGLYREVVSVDNEAYSKAEIRAIKQALTPEMCRQLTEVKNGKTEYSGQAKRLFDSCVGVLQKERSNRSDDRDVYSIHRNRALRKQFDVALNQEVQPEKQQGGKVNREGDKGKEKEEEKTKKNNQKGKRKVTSNGGLKIRQLQELVGDMSLEEENIGKQKTKEEQGNKEKQKKTSQKKNRGNDLPLEEENTKKKREKSYNQLFSEVSEGIKVPVTDLDAVDPVTVALECLYGDNSKSESDDTSQIAETSKKESQDRLVSLEGSIGEGSDYTAQVPKDRKGILQALSAKVGGSNKEKLHNEKAKLDNTPQSEFQPKPEYQRKPIPSKQPKTSHTQSPITQGNGYMPIPHEPVNNEALLKALEAKRKKAAKKVEADKQHSIFDTYLGDSIGKASLAGGVIAMGVGVLVFLTGGVGLLAFPIAFAILAIPVILQHHKESNHKNALDKIEQEIAAVEQEETLIRKPSLPASEVTKAQVKGKESSFTERLNQASHTHTHHHSRGG